MEEGRRGKEGFGEMLLVSCLASLLARDPYSCLSYRYRNNPKTPLECRAEAEKFKAAVAGVEKVSLPSLVCCDLKLTRCVNRLSSLPSIRFTPSLSLSSSPVSCQNVEFDQVYNLFRQSSLAIFGLELRRQDVTAMTRA